jgi:uncharacterized protein YbaP (TraB family)
MAKMMFCPKFIKLQNLLKKNRDLIANRSQEMFDTVVKLLNDEQNSMLAVGAAHLFGKYGLLETFKEAGYPVVRIHFNK